MGRNCFLCGRKSSAEKSISLHKFPKEEVQCEKWRDACKLTKVDDVSRIHICSLHFSEDNLQVVHCRGNPQVELLRNAVPSILLPQKPLAPTVFLTRKCDDSQIKENILIRITDYSAASDETSSENNFSENSPDSNRQAKTTTIRLVNPKKPLISAAVNWNSVNSSINSINEPLENDSTNSHVDSKETETEHNYSKIISTEIVEEKDDDQCQPTQVPNRSSMRFFDDSRISPDEDVSSSTGEADGINETSPITIKRRFYDPRFISEITENDLSTPARRRRALHLIKDRDRKKSLKLKKLMARTRYMQKRIETLEEMLKNYLTQET